LSHHALEAGRTEILLRGIGAGWLVAALVWVMPNSEGGRIWLIVLFTWLIGVAGFAHVVAGTTEATLVAFADGQSLSQPITGFILPALIGNLIGGTLLFTVLTYAQIRGELYSHSPDSSRGGPRRP
ncbi:formate/nitrite transporter family protein, partial [Thioclava sp. BHET1]